MTRQIILDTETTGLDPTQGHRIIEIGALEMIDRRLTGKQFHYYLNPGRDIEPGAIAVHGISNEFLADKPNFSEILAELLEYIEGAQLIIHNAPFDVGFLDHEFKLAKHDPANVKHYCGVLDTLQMARKLHPGQKNSLDALCKRYEIDNTHRTLHGALLDAGILAQVYLAMTGGQATLFEEQKVDADAVKIDKEKTKQKIIKKRPSLEIIAANEVEMIAHQQWIEVLKKSENGSLWQEGE